MARVLIVGCGCRGQALARRLRDDGHAVRGTTRREEALAAIEASGAEGVIADPYRLATMLGELDGITIAVWLLGSADGNRDELAALHGTRLESFLHTLIDTHVRGCVYEAAGTVDSDLLEGGIEIGRRAGERHPIPFVPVEAPPADVAAWLDAMSAAVAEVLRR
jgi:uncharacterized protein YbjT (DUF2867 family)